MKEKWEVTVVDCEHEGDLERCASDMVKAGASIVSTRMTDYDHEEGEITFTVPKKGIKAFREKFNETDSGDFVEGWTCLGQVV